MSDRGVPLVGLDVVISRNISEQQSCPGTSHQVQTSTSNGLTTFNWSDNDQFKISISSGETTETFRLHLYQGEGEAWYYKVAEYACLSNPGTTESSDKKELTISVNSNDLKLRCYESPDDSEENYISITLPTGYSIEVMK